MAYMNERVGVAGIFDGFFSYFGAPAKPAPARAPAARPGQSFGTPQSAYAELMTRLAVQAAQDESARQAREAEDRRQRDQVALLQSWMETQQAQAQSQASIAASQARASKNAWQTSVPAAGAQVANGPWAALSSMFGKRR